MMMHVCWFLFVVLICLSRKVSTGRLSFKKTENVKLETYEINPLYIIE